MRNPGSGTGFNSKLFAQTLWNKRACASNSRPLQTSLEEAPGGKQNMQKINLDHLYDLKKKKKNYPVS